MKRTNTIAFLLAAAACFCLTACNPAAGSTPQPDTTALTQRSTAEQTTTAAAPKTEQTTVTSAADKTEQTTSGTAYSYSALCRCADILNEKAADCITSAGVSQAENCVLVSCPDAEKESELKSRLEELEIDPEMLRFEPYSEPVQPM
ncbi:MAG: hypothetical protein II723_07105 [Oscillospiraceae bacterium]|nr:hypothetical protein [Oscillospiraceae bacterium]